MKLAKFQDALSTYVQVLPYCKKDKNQLSSAYDDISNVNYFLGRFSEAINASNTAISISGGTADNYYFRAKNYLKKNDNVHATADFRKALETSTDKKSDAYAFSLFYTGNQQQAISLLKSRLSDENDNQTTITLKYNLACMYALAGQVGDANRYLALSINSGYSKRYAIEDSDLDNIKNTDDFKKLLR